MTLSPQEVVQGAGARRRLGVDLVIPSVPAHRVLPEAQELLLVSQHAAVVGVADVVRVGQPLHVVVVVAWKRKSEFGKMLKNRQSASGRLCGKCGRGPHSLW